MVCICAANIRKVLQCFLREAFAQLENAAELKLPFKKVVSRKRKLYIELNSFCCPPKHCKSAILKTFIERRYKYDCYFKNLR